jgi:hypothetical protein
MPSNASQGGPGNVRGISFCFQPVCGGLCSFQDEFDCPASEGLDLQTSPKVLIFRTSLETQGRVGDRSEPCEVTIEFAESFGLSPCSR